MQKTFIEALENEIKKAEENYQEAKNQVLINFKRDNIFSEIHTFTEFGAAYATHIDQITRYATEIKTLYHVKLVYEYYQKQAE